MISTAKWRRHLTRSAIRFRARVRAIATNASSRHFGVGSGITGISTRLDSSSAAVADLPVCPICGGVSRLRYALPPAKIRGALEQYYIKELPDAVVIPETSLFRCVLCTLEYAHPAVTGSDAFYEFLA